MQALHGLIRRELTHAMATAAHAEKMSLQSDAIAFALSSHLSVVNVPVAGLEKLDFKSMFDGYPILENIPIMYWYLAGEVLKESAFPFSAGFYTVVAHQQQGTVELRDTKGRTVARGGLGVCIGPGGPPTVGTAMLSVSGGIDKFDINLKKHHIEVCGHASVSVGGAEVKVEGCISVDY
ncbi:MAG: hypothetical protein QM706_01305 [Nitrospira sp.]